VDVVYRRVLHRMLLSDEAQFNRNGINNTPNSHLWFADNPRETTESSFRHPSVNVLCGLIENLLLEPFLWDQHLIATNYLSF
jgi:hypothetical protein